MTISKHYLKGFKMKLYEVPRETLIKHAGHQFMFHHVDGMYSLCTHIETNSTQHLSAIAEVEIIEVTKNEK